jgi:hypothetical protein
MDREHIASIVQAPTIATPFGGSCLYRAVIGKLVLAHLGVEASVETGSAVLAPGPRPFRLLEHAWLSVGDDIVDLSCNEWPTLLVGAQWTVPPPKFIWGPRGGLWRGSLDLLPTLGCVFYGRALTGTPWDLPAAEATVRRQLWPQVRRALP